MPGPENEIPDIMTRWAYPACETEGDVSMHGSPEDDKKMREIIEEDKALEKQCCVFSLKGPDRILPVVRIAGVQVDVANV